MRWLRRSRLHDCRFAGSCCQVTKIFAVSRRAVSAHSGDLAAPVLGPLTRTIEVGERLAIEPTLTNKVPRELFESVEKAAMLAPPTVPFDVPRWIDDAKVHPDHHVQVACALYSVPTLYLHKQVRVRADKTSVRIYFGTALTGIVYCAVI
jgi:hypothetical protein